MGPQFVEKHLNEMKLGTVFSVLLVLFLGLALSEGRRFEGRKRGARIGRGGKGGRLGRFLRKLDDDCKDLFRNLKAECADDTFPWVFKGKACADINVGDLLPKKQKPEAGTEKPPKPCTETQDGEEETLGEENNCLVCVKKQESNEDDVEAPSRLPRDRMMRRRGGKRKGPKVVASMEGAEDVTFIATCQDGRISSIAC